MLKKFTLRSEDKTVAQKEINLLPKFFYFLVKKKV